MIINILKKQDLYSVKELPTEVLSAIEAIIELQINEGVIRYLVKEGSSE